MRFNPSIHPLELTGNFLVTVNSALVCTLLKLHEMIQLRTRYCELACMKTLILWIGKNLYTMYLLFFFFLASLQLTPTQVQPKNFKWRTFFDSPFCIWLLFHFRVAFISLEVGFCWSSRISNSFLVCSAILHTQRKKQKETQIETFKRYTRTH